MTNRMDLPSPNAPNYGQRVRETLMTFLGRQGDKRDRALTLRDMLDLGIVELKPGFSLGSGGSPLIPGPNIGGTKPDLNPPPTPTGLALTGGISNFFIEHDAPAFTQGHGYLRTNVYGVTYDGTGPEPTFSDAVRIVSFSGEVYAYPSDPSTTWRIWIKWETNDGVESIDPAGGTNGAEVTTGQDVTKLVQAMTGPGNPFKVVTEAILLPDGTVVPPGTYMSDAYIHRMQVQEAMIHDLAVTDAKVADLSASKLTAGSIAVGQYVQSSSYVAGSSGWRIDGNGNTEMSNGVFRGTVFASAGSFTGTINAASGSFAGSITGASGNFRGQITGGSFTGYAWPAAGLTGFYLGPLGILLGNANNGRYFQVSADGNVSAPGFTIQNGAAVFSGSLSVQSAPSGQRTVLNNNGGQVFYSSGALAVRWGIW